VEFLIVTVLLLVVAAIAGWPWLKLYVVPMWFRSVLIFNTPRPDAQAEVWTFTGVNLGVRFFGMATSQQAYLAPPEPASGRIILDQ
jgi:hypothetical protein